MKIAVLSTGRFWLCDLARELDALGHEVAFYSLVPPWRTRRFGLPSRCNRWLAPYVAPLMLGHKLTGGALGEWCSRALWSALDRAAAITLGPCDLLIAISGVFPRAQESARRRYGARVFVERGSRHILSQREILEAIRLPGAPPPVPEWAVRAELEDYERADTIVVPSRHVLRSFEERGVLRKIARNPFGVDLTTFRPTPSPTSIGPTIITVGQWSLRKGVDVLVEAWRGLPGVELAHVGPVVDAPVPPDPGFTHHEPVQQDSLPAFYSRAHVFALASREEGLALVQAQALASGLDLVCTDRTGGEDLKDALREGEAAIDVVPSDAPDRLRAALHAALARASARVGLRDLMGEQASTLSWQAYGRRYQTIIEERR